MSLLEESMEQCILLNKTSGPDGYGGRMDVWTDSDFTFKAAIVFSTSLESRVAEKQGVTALYTVTTRKATNLQFHDVFRRISDGKVFRVTSDGDDNKTPNSAALNMRQVNAEEWAITNG